MSDPIQDIARQLGITTFGDGLLTKIRETIDLLQSDANNLMQYKEVAAELEAELAATVKDSLTVGKAQMARDSAELRRLCAERDKLKAKMSGVDDRAEFESAYLKANYPRVHSGELSAPPIFVKTKAGEYDDPDMQRTWIMWQARATLSAPNHGEQVREGWQLVPVELIEHVKHARKMLGGNGAPEWQRERLRQKLTDLLAAAPAQPQSDGVVVPKELSE